MTTIAPRSVPRSALVPDVFRLMEIFPFVDRHVVRVEEYLEDDGYVVRAEMPGLDPAKDITLTVSATELTIEANRPEHRHEQGSSEFHYGTLRRSVTLPRGVDTSTVRALYDAGILEVRIPVARPPEPRRITVGR
jgi:HSP20 family protein